MIDAVWTALTDPALLHPARLSLQIALITLGLHAVFGTLLAWALAQPSWPGRTLLDALVTVPLVLPPIALGFFLLILLGRRSPLGQWLDQGVGLSFVFSVEGVLLASFVAGLPLVVKPIEAAIAGISKTLGEASRTLGRGEIDTFLFVILPNIRGVLVAALVLGTARSLGEVGITLMLGGNIIGKTNTVSLEVYNAVFNGDYARAAVLSALLGLVALAVFAVIRRSGRPAI
jgi:molybdate transport system permease protein